jgi:hypothetical protein
MAGESVDWYDEEKPMDPDEEDRYWNVYRGYKEPVDDEDWKKIFDYFTGVTEFTDPKCPKREFGPWVAAP